MALEKKKEKTKWDLVEVGDGGRHSLHGQHHFRVHPVICSKQTPGHVIEKISVGPRGLASRHLQSAGSYNINGKCSIKKIGNF